MNALLWGPVLAMKQASVIVIAGFVFILATSHDIVWAAVIAGFFTLLNTGLNTKLSRNIKKARKTSKEATEILVSELSKKKDK